jgi:hypothetical protein
MLERLVSADYARDLIVKGQYALKVLLNLGNEGFKLLRINILWRTTQASELHLPTISVFEAGASGVDI